MPRQRHAVTNNPECLASNRKHERARSPEARNHDAKNNAIKSRPKKLKSEQLTRFLATQLMSLQTKLKRVHTRHVSNSIVTPYRLGDEDILHRWRPVILEGIPAPLAQENAAVPAQENTAVK